MLKNLQHLWIHIINLKNPMVIRIFKFLDDINLMRFILTTGTFYIMGLLINHYSPFPQFYLFQNLFIGIFIGAFVSVRHFRKQMRELRCTMAGDRTLHSINDKMERWQYSTLNLIVPPIAGAFFGILAILLININIKSISAYYLVLAYVECVLISFIGYLQYVYLFFYIVKIGKNNEITKYDEDYPSSTVWLTTLTKLYCRYRNTFFVLGMMYVFSVIYFVFCGEFKIIQKIEAFPRYKIALVLFWGGVLCAIVIIFPVISIIEYIYIRKTVDNLKEQAVLKVNRWSSEREDIKFKLEKANLIISIRNTPDYPFKDAVGIVFSCIVTCTNLAASIVAILQLNIV